jgi:membrane protein
MLYRIWTLTSSTFLIWDKANSSRMSAAMTYYTMLSLAPLLMIAIAIAGYVYDSKQAQAEVIQNVKVATSPAIAKTVAGMIKNATRPSSGILASSISLLVLFYGASGVFSQLYDTFNDIWEVPPETRTGILFSLQKRMIGVGMVLAAGLILIGTLMLGSVIAYLNGLVDSYPRISSWLSLADRSMSFLLMPFLFALIFWFFPATKVQWRDVWPAGVLTACLVAASRYLIDFYLRFSSTSEVYGAAGSLVVLLIWVYMTGLVVFFGASFCYAWAKTFGSLSDKNRPKMASKSNDETTPTDAETETKKLNTTAGSTAIDGHASSVPPLILHRRSNDS